MYIDQEACLQRTEAKKGQKPSLITKKLPELTVWLDKKKISTHE